MYIYQISENKEEEKKLRFGGVKIGKNLRADSPILGNRMTLECFVSIVQSQKLMANSLNKPKQKV